MEATIEHIERSINSYEGIIELNRAEIDKLKSTDYRQVENYSSMIATCKSIILELKEVLQTAKNEQLETA